MTPPRVIPKAFFQCVQVQSCNLRSFVRLDTVVPKSYFTAHRIRSDKNPFLFFSQSNINFSINSIYINRKSGHVVLGIRTWCRRIQRDNHGGFFLNQQIQLFLKC